MLNTYTLKTVIELLVILQRDTILIARLTNKLSMNNFFSRLTLVVILFLFQASVSAQNYFWKDILESKVAVGDKQRKIVPLKYRTLSLDTGMLTAFLKTVPKEFTEAAKK